MLMKENLTWNLQNLRRKKQKDELTDANSRDQTRSQKEGVNFGQVRQDLENIFKSPRVFGIFTDFLRVLSPPSSSKILAKPLAGGKTIMWRKILASSLVWQYLKFKLLEGESIDLCSRYQMISKSVATSLA